MKQPKCHNVLFDGMNSDKDPLGYGHNEHWTELQRYGAGKSMYELEHESNLWPNFVKIALAIAALYFGSHLVYWLWRMM